MSIHKIIVHYNPTNRYENQCMDNSHGLLKDTGEVRFRHMWVIYDNQVAMGFLGLEVVHPSTSLQQQENVKTGKKGHLHKNPVFAAFTIARRERFIALPQLLS